MIIAVTFLIVLVVDSYRCFIARCHHCTTMLITVIVPLNV